MMKFAFKLVIFALKMMIFALKMMIFALKMMLFTARNLARAGAQLHPPDVRRRLQVRFSIDFSTVFGCFSTVFGCFSADFRLTFG